MVRIYLQRTCKYVQIDLVGNYFELAFDVTIYKSITLLDAFHATTDCVKGALLLCQIQRGCKEVAHRP